MSKPFVTPQGFMERFYKNCWKCATYKAAYELTEQQYMAEFGVRKYANYDSFRRAMAYHNNS